MARHKIVVKWSDILMGRNFDEAKFGRWRFGALVVCKTNWNPWHADSRFLRPTLGVKP